MTDPAERQDDIQASGNSRVTDGYSQEQTPKREKDGYLTISEPPKPRFAGIRDKSDSIASNETPGHFSFISRRNRQKTALDEVPHDGRHYRHQYVIRRPRPLQYRYKGKTYESGELGRLDLHESQDQSEGAQDLSRESSKSKSPTQNGEQSQRSTDDPDVQRERMELFIDLLFVGIITNISEHFFSEAFSPEASSGLAVLEFILLFMPIWVIWSRLQLFLNAWFMDDFFQRFVVVWILILSLVYGNNVPYFLLTNDSQSNYLIVTYLIAKVSLVIMEVIYSFFFPWLRRLMVIGFILTLPSTAIWVSATLTIGWTQVGLVIAGIFTDYASQLFFMSPLGERALGNDIQKARDEKHSIKRYANFFIIALGEGVILLIRDSPAGKGLNFRLGNCVLALLILYALHYLYFNADQSYRFVHALYRRWYIQVMWGFIHIPLFMNLVLLSSGILYLVKYQPGCDSNGSPEESHPAKRAETECAFDEERGISASHETMRIATTAVCINTAIILLMELFLALLNRSLDPPKTLLIDNRFIRLLPRMAAIVVLVTIWVHDFKDSASVLGVITLIVWVVLKWEWHVSMERGGGFIEPKDSWKQEVDRSERE